MTTSSPHRARAALALLALTISLALALATQARAADSVLPDPLQRGPYAVKTVEPYRLGTVNLQEPNAAGGALTGSASAVTLQVRGAMYLPQGRKAPAPVLILVNGNHTQCDSGTSPNCTVFKRNYAGYAYLAENLASWGYASISVDQDQMMAFQDGLARGMHQRRLLIAATLDALYKANLQPLADDPNTNVGASLVGKLDFSRIGLMGHSRGGDAVTSFIDYNRERPAPGRRYPLRAVISLAGTDYERRAPSGVPYLAHLPLCDGDVSNLHAARNFERAQYIDPTNPFPAVQFAIHGTNHNWYNSVWDRDGEDSNTGDAACTLASPTTVRMSRGQYADPFRDSGDPARMGDQARAGLATMSAFFRRYVGGEQDFEAYVTGELVQDGKPQLPETACPRDPGGTAFSCDERMLTSYFPGAGERRDVLRPEPDGPLKVSALGTAIDAAGFSNPFQADGAIPVPPTTTSGLDWCNPEPTHFSDTAVGLPAPNRPRGDKPCPQPADAALGGQASTRENAPINHSYGLQLAVAWNDPVTATGAPARLGVRVPQASGDVSGFKALALSAAVNFFDTRNPDRSAIDGGAALWNPSTITQDFTIAVRDAKGVEATVSAASPRYGNALHPTIGSTTSKVHVLLNEIRVPLGDLAAQGVDLTAVRRVELRFGETGKPASGSLQLADVRFQEPVGGSTVYAETTRGGPATGDLTSGPDPMDTIAGAARTTVAEAGDVIGLDGTTAVGACVDTTAPTLGTVRTATTAGGGLRVRGLAADSGCSAGVPRTVQVAIAKRATTGCAFVTARGTLTRTRSCGTPVALVAKGRRAFSLTTRRLPSGTYRVVVQAIDGQGNVTTRTRTAQVG